MMSAQRDLESYRYALTWDDYSALLNAGVPSIALLGDGDFLIGAARATLDADGTWTPDPHGERVVVIPADDCDLVAMKLEDVIAGDVRRWWRRYGDADILGRENIFECEHYAKVLPIWSNPLSWLRSGGQGVCILRRGGLLALYFGGLVAVACETPKLAERVTAALRPKSREPLVRLLVRGGARDAA